MEDNKREIPFVYNLGDRLKYICGKGEMITVIERYHQYDKKTGTVRNVYLLTIENYEGYGYTIQKYASEKYMMSNMRRVYSADNYVMKLKEFFNPEDFEKRSNDALSCGYYKALEEEKKKWKVTDDDLPLILESLKEVGIDVKCDDSKDRLNVELKNENAFLRHKLREAEAQYKKEKNDAKIEKAINCRGDAIRKDIKCINETLTSVFDGFYEKGKELKEENEKLQKENEGLRHKLREAEAQYKKEKNECDNVEEGKETLDKINSALSNLIGYDDLVLRVKVGDDQVKCIKIDEDTIEFETVDKNIRELQKENEGLKEKIDILKKKIERRERDIVNWKKGWYDCLDSFNYYLKA